MNKDNGGCGCRDEAVEETVEEAPSRERDAEESSGGCACGCGGHGGSAGKANSEAARAARDAGYSDISEGRENLGLRGVR